MPNIGPLELAIVLIIALVIFGPKRLPELGRSVGHGLREFKSSITGEDKDDDEAAHDRQRRRGRRGGGADPRPRPLPRGRPSRLHHRQAVSAQRR